MIKRKNEKEIKIFSGKGHFKNSFISSGSGIKIEDNLNNNNKYDNQNQMEYNTKINKKKVRKETSLKQTSSNKLNPFYFKNVNNSPIKNTPSINGNLSKNNNPSSMAEHSSFFENNSEKVSSNTNKISYLPGNDKNNSEYNNSQDNNSQSKSSYISNTVSEIEEDEKENDENETNN